MSATGTEQSGTYSPGKTAAPQFQPKRAPAWSTFREYGLPLLLLVISVITTTANGARFMQNFVEGMAPVVRDSDLWPWGWLSDHPEMFKTGWAFSFSLLGILLIHEFGHYFACRWHRIRATLPWVLPAPTLSGTAGAIIQIRGRISSRDALMDIGIYGPLAGYVASAVAVAVGFALSYHTAANAPPAIVVFGGEPPTIRLIHALLVQWDPSIPAFDHLAPHPVLVAGWIGLFITSLNLIPGGQLDGGHILYALSPRAHKLFTNLLPPVLFIMGTLYWVGWLLWGLILMIPAMRHPKVPVSPQLSQGRLTLAVIGLAIFLLTFTPTPFYDSSLMHFLHIVPFRFTP
ncbi:MAG: site-2 protease family protein [Terracidiphilus sp.]|jgi:membrane-associated protease RseP (regulator of RpoE activity)